MSTYSWQRSANPSQRCERVTPQQDISQHRVEKMLKPKYTRGSSCWVAPGTCLTPNIPSWQGQGQELNLHLPWGPDAHGNHPA